MPDEQLEQLAALIDEFYATISGPAGPRDWARERELFHPQARLMRTGVDEAGRPWIRVMSVDDYIEDTTPFFAANDFHEIEVARRVDRFGNWAHVRSVYEARRSPGDPELLKRGVNSIQLFHDGERWRVVSVLWDNERAGLEVPAEWR
ncbi:MAG TPA: hypothetical protein VFS60_16180 [Thermoanaerobaculia bacterium]|nr:hypothetical protein [Thermoanaerobaculia bacterium]